MDELMARFVTNLDRNECKLKFEDNKKLLYSKNFVATDSAEIEKSVKLSVNALKALLMSNTIDMERQPNSENHLYLKIMERAQEENKLNLINMVSSKIYQLVKTEKPKHL